jgi:regulator of sigma D
MSHIAFDLITLIDKLPLRIECIDTFGNMLAVGTSEGHLLIYDIVTKEVNGNVAYPLVDLIGISY